MGCDGGSIPKRSELVKTKSRPSTTEKLENSVFWNHCYLSGDPLSVPVSTCSRGKLYNKEALLHYLLKRAEDQVPPEDDPIPHIKSFKDLVKLNLCENTSFEEPDNVIAGNTVNRGQSRFICPVTRSEMNGRLKFVYLKGCGCVMSEQALEQVKSECCLSCGRVRMENDVVALCPEPLVDDNKVATMSSAEKKVSAKKQPAKNPLLHTKKRSSEDLPYLPSPQDFPPSLSGMSTFRKTKAVKSLYNTEGTNE